MTLSSSGGDFALPAKTLSFSGRLRALFGRRRSPQKPPNADDWARAEEATSPGGHVALEQELLPQDLEHWRQPQPQPAEASRGSHSSRPRTRDGEYDTRGATASGSLIVQSLSKSFKGRQIIKDVSLIVRRGEAVGLLGPNGAGKTTLFYMITGLVRPESGLIMLDDYDVTGLPMYRRARLGIGYLPQEPSIFRGLSVENNILAVLEVTQPNKRQRAEELESLLAEFDIARLRKLPAIALSGGERRRCEIARALAGHPSFMLLDEPFAGIDPIAIGDIRMLVQHLTRRGIGVLITDHNVRETLDLIDRAYIVHSGHILTEGSPEQIVTNPDVRRLYLGERFKM